MNTVGIFPVPISGFLFDTHHHKQLKEKCLYITETKSFTENGSQIRPSFRGVGESVGVGETIVCPTRSSSEANFACRTASSPCRACGAIACNSADVMESLCAPNIFSATSRSPSGRMGGGAAANGSFSGPRPSM